MNWSVTISCISSIASPGCACIICASKGVTLQISIHLCPLTGWIWYFSFKREYKDTSRDSSHSELKVMGKNKV